MQFSIVQVHSFESNQLLNEHKLIMKVSCALFAIICIVGVHAGHAHNIDLQQLAKIKTHADICTRITNYNQNEVKKIMIGQDATYSNEYDCWLACVIRRVGIMNVDGTVNYKSNDSDVAKKCKDRRGIHACDTAAKVMACLDERNLVNFD